MPHVAKRHRRGSSLPSEVSALRRQLLLDPEARERVLTRLVAILYGADAAAALLACDVLAQLGGPACMLPLVETVLWSDPDGGELQRELRIAALEGLRSAAADDDTVVSTFLAASRDPDPEIAWLAAAALGDGRATAARASRALVPCLEHGDGRVRRAARRSLTRLAATRAA
ncbi:MAG: HEAT repeat domain-containing protein [Polyangiaceae bacterium]